MHLDGQHERRSRPDAGYAMAVLLAGLAIMGIAWTVVVPVWKQYVQREKEAELIFRAGQYARAVALYQRKYANAFPPNVDVPRIKNFAQRYKAKFGEEAHGFAAQSYDGLMMVAAAMQKAGTVKDRKAIRDALAALRYEGVIGTIQFDKTGQASPPVYVTQWCSDGKRRVIYPDSMKADCGAG